jgi:hypothetical protein
VIYSFLEIQPHHYTAMVEDLTGQRSRLTLQITDRDPQGAFDWSCGNRGLKRVGDLEQAQEESTMETSNPTNTWTIGLDAI